MYRTRVVCGITALFLVTGVVVTAQRGNSAAVKPQHSTSPAPKPAAVPHVASKAVQPAATHAPKTAPKTMTPAVTPKAVAPKAVAPKPTTKAAPQVAKTDKNAAKAVPQKSVKPVETKQVAKTDKTTKIEKPVKIAKVEKPAKEVEKAPGTLTAVQQKLQKNTNLAAKLTSRLPAGTDLMAASAGFRNLGQFVAAVNVSHNLGLSFTDLKAKMVTGGMSLGQAIQAVRPLTASATIEAQHAEYDARGMIAESEQEPQVVTVAAPAKTKAKTKKTGQ